MEALRDGVTRRVALRRIAAGLVAARTGSAFAADAWPAKPVRIVVPFAPGGGADIAARVLAEMFAPGLGQSVVVENKPGAGGAIGVTFVTQAKDQHTLLMGSNSLLIAPILNATLPYEAVRDFDVIGMASANRTPLRTARPAAARRPTSACACWRKPRARSSSTCPTKASARPMSI